MSREYLVKGLDDEDVKVKKLCFCYFCCCCFVFDVCYCYCCCCCVVVVVFVYDVCYCCFVFVVLLMLKLKVDLLRPQKDQVKTVTKSFLTSLSSSEHLVINSVRLVFSSLNLTCCSLILFNVLFNYGVSELMISLVCSSDVFFAFKSGLSSKL